MQNMKTVFGNFTLGFREDQSLQINADFGGHFQPSIWLVKQSLIFSLTSHLNIVNNTNPEAFKLYLIQSIPNSYIRLAKRHLTEQMPIIASITFL